MQNLLQRSALLFRTSQPPGAPLEYEAISQGCFPIIWKGTGVVFERYYETLGLVLKDDDSESVLFSKIDCLLNDTKIREFLYNICKPEINVHYNYDFIVKQLLSSLETNG